MIVANESSVESRTWSRVESWRAHGERLLALLNSLARPVKNKDDLTVMLLKRT